MFIYFFLFKQTCPGPRRPSTSTANTSKINFLLYKNHCNCLDILPKMDLSRFALLPAELQSLVWQYFVDDATADARVLDFSIRVDKADHRQRWKAVPGPLLYDRARPAATALSVCRESRYFALKALPDTLAVERGRRRGIVRFNKDRDIVAISAISVINQIPFFDFDRTENPSCIIPGFSDNIRNLALKGMVVGDYGLMTKAERYPILINLWNLLAMFHNLRTLFELMSWDEYAPHTMAWCTASEGVTVQEVAVHPHPRSRILEPLTTIWPDVTTSHPAGMTGNTHLQPKQLGWLSDRLTELSNMDNRDFIAWIAGFKAWPMVEFYGTTAHQALAELRTTPVGQLPMGDEWDTDEAKSCKTEADEDGWSRKGYEDEAEIGPGDNCSVCSDDFPVEMASILAKSQRWFCARCKIEEPETDCDMLMDRDHVYKWLDGIV